MSDCAKFLTSILLLLNLHLLHAQDADSTSDSTVGQKKKRPGLDTLYIRQYPDYLMLGLYSTTPIMSIQVNPLEDSLARYGSHFLGNFSNSLGLNFGYRSVGFRFAVRVPIDPSSVDQLGQTMYRLLSLKIRKMPFILSLDYRKYNGFYDDNSANHDSTITHAKPYHIRPDILFKSYSASMLLNFSWRKYSYTAPVTFNERQIKTRFGFLLNSNFNYIRYSADSSFVMPTQNPFFQDFMNVRSIDALILKVGPGVGMNLVVFKRLYFAMNVFFMGNALLYRYENESSAASRWRSNVNVFYEGSSAIGFNSERFYLGIRLSADNNLMRIKGANIRTNFGSASIDMGFRFNTPGFFRKAWDKTLTRYLKL
jgi:hypothetical protein